MELNTNSYIKHKSKIDEYWQDQVSAGSWGRADLKEVAGSFESLKEKIIGDANLSQEHKDELLGIIIKKVELLKAREDEILKAEDTMTQEKVSALGKARDRLKGLPYQQQEKYGALKKMLLDKGYDIFLTSEEIDKLFNGEESYDELKDRLKKEFPIIARDFVPEIEKTEKRLETSKGEK